MCDVTLFSHTMMQDLDFAEIVDLIRKEDARFDKRAYFFVRQGLDQTVKNLKKTDPNGSRNRHMCPGRELLEGMRVYRTRSIRSARQDRARILGRPAVLRFWRDCFQSDRIQGIQQDRDRSARGFR